MLNVVQERNHLMYNIIGGVVWGCGLQENCNMYMDFQLYVHVFSTDCRCDDVSVQCVCVCVTYYTCLSSHVQDGTSPLMTAAQTGKTDVVVDLLGAGANINLQNKVCHYIQ